MQLLCLFIYTLIFQHTDTVNWNRYHITGYAQGTTYSIIYYAADSVVTKNIIDQQFANLDSSLSLYKSYSLINQFNNAERGIAADQHLFQVVKKSIDTYYATNGLFDITVHPLVNAWGFGASKSKTIPDSAAIMSILPCVSSSLLQLRNDSLLKVNSCVKIDLDGIAQGYSVDILATLLEKKNITNYIIELGGEIRVKGRKQPGGEMMKIGIESPAEDPFAPGTFQKTISFDHGAITTSGSYRKFFESNGQKITHIINPLSGYPQNNELISVTVYAADAITADAYDNAFMLMGLKDALQFLEKRDDLAAFFIYKNSKGVITDTASNNFLKLLKL